MPIQRKICAFPSQIRFFQKYDQTITSIQNDLNFSLTFQVRPLFERIGFEERSSDGHLDVFLRGQAVRWACKMDMPECIDEAKSNFRDWMEEGDPDTENP